MKKTFLIFLFAFISVCVSAQSVFHSNIPIVLINTNNVAIPNEPKIAATMQIIYKGAGQISYITDPPNVYNGKIGIEQRGAFSASLPQKPYNFETRNAGGLAMDTALLGMPSEHDWLLIANYNDKAFVRNTLSYDLFDKMGHYAARSRHCEVFLNGQYQGIYLLMEKLKRDKKRIDIAKLDKDDNAGDSLTGGYILKNDYWNSSNSWLSNYHPVTHPTFPVHFVYEYPNKDSITSQQKAYIKSFINNLEAALYSSNFANPSTGYAKYISMQSFIDYFIVNELSRNVDGFKKSIFMYKEKDSSGTIGKLKYGPVWDFDWAWKNIIDCSIFQATNGSGWSHLINNCGPDVYSSDWFVRLKQDTGFTNKLKCRWTNLRKSILDTTYLFNHIDSVAQLLDSAQQRHYVKWGHLGQNSGAPEVGSIPTTFLGEVNALKSWIKKRITWLDANMPGTLNGCSFTGVEEEHLTYEIEVFPNPSSGNISIWSPVRIFRSLEVLDVYGNVIIKHSTENSSQTLDLSGYAAGIYFVKLVDENGKFGVQKIVLQ